MLVSLKLDTVHSRISKALEDCSISDDEYKLIVDEVEKYRAVSLANYAQETPFCNFFSRRSHVNKVNQEHIFLRCD